MDKTNTNIEDMRAVAAEAVSKSVKGAKSRVDAQSRAAISEAVPQAEEQARIEFEELKAQLESARSRIEKLEDAIANAQNNDGKEPRNLVVCIDGTANQFGVKVDLQPTRPSCNSMSIFILHTEL